MSYFQITKYTNIYLGNRCINECISHPEGFGKMPHDGQNHNIDPLPAGPSQGQGNGAGKLEYDVWRGMRKMDSSSKNGDDLTSSIGSPTRKSKRMRNFMIGMIAIFALIVLIPGTAMAAGDPSGGSTYTHDLDGSLLAMDFVWILICAFLVFFMQAGFALLEAGMCRVKNVANVLMKNMVDFLLGSIAFFVIGYSIMMGGDIAGIIGDPTSAIMLTGDSYDVSTMLLWFFMLVFAATAATIVSGAIAERPKFKVYVIYSIVVSALIYPVYGHWVWGGGWLAASDFMTDLGGGYGALDFAGSGVVHAMGGFIALAGCILIGPRIGKYTKEGKPRPIPGHNITLVVLGGFILFFGWFGFNPGSTLSSQELVIARIAVTTTLAGAAGGITAMFITWHKMKSPDVSMTVNGMIAGLVAVTAGCAWVAPWAAVVIGIVAGFVVCYGIWFIEKKGIDDMVGAVSVHGLNGVWGLLALGIFADGTYGNYTTEGPLVTGLLYGNAGFFLCQVISAVVVVAFAFGCGYVLFYTLKKTIGLRVSPAEELEGLDISEHNTVAYPGMVLKEVNIGSDEK
jgi:ammonium transporter, Amt family